MFPLFFCVLSFIYMIAGWSPAQARIESGTLGPCGGGFCREICTYTGKADHSGQVQVQTEWVHSAASITLRTKLSLKASYFFYDIQYLIDDITSFDPNGRPIHIDLNTRYLLDDKINRQMWDRFVLDWSSQPRLIQAWRIQGRKQNEFTSRHPGFVAHWPATAFGGAWSKDFASGQPERRPDMDVPGFPENIITPLALSFFTVRFLEPREPYTFDILLGSDHEQKTSPNQMQARIKGSQATWQSRLRVGDLESPANKPSEFAVDTTSHLLQSVRLHLGNSFGQVDGTVTLQRCDVQPL